MCWSKTIIFSCFLFTTEPFRSSRQLFFILLLFILLKRAAIWRWRGHKIRKHCMLLLFWWICFAFYLSTCFKICILWDVCNIACCTLLGVAYKFQHNILLTSLNFQILPHPVCVLRSAVLYRVSLTQRGRFVYCAILLLYSVSTHKVAQLLQTSAEKGYINNVEMCIPLYRAFAVNAMLTVTSKQSKLMKSAELIMNI